MKGLTRRRFLTHGSIGVALGGALALVPFMATAMKQQFTTPKFSVRSANPGGALVAHVRDLASGEIAFLVGSERFIVRDRELAVRLHAAARSAR